MVVVQGMSDLCAPILAVLRDEAEAFWCFAALMDRLEGNFNTDCTCGRSPPPSECMPSPMPWLPIYGSLTLWPQRPPAGMCIGSIL